MRIEPSDVVRWSWVELSRTSDRWRRGDRYGQVLDHTYKDGERVARVRMQKSKSIILVHPSNIFQVLDSPLPVAAETSKRPSRHP